MKKLKVGILFGGKSAEHEVSLQSAKNIVEALDKEKFEPVLIGIDKQGGWQAGKAAELLLASGGIPLSATNEQPVALAGSSLVELKDGRPHGQLDVVFPVLHGPLGEDGTVQGLLRLADLPFVGSGVLGSAIGMDKDVMKRLLREAGLPIGDFRVFRFWQRKDISFSRLEKELGLPFFVKPANMGSSVGVAKVRDESELQSALETAFLYDTKIICERFIPGRELECSVLGNQEPIASLPGEVIPQADFYSYEAKYLDENGALLEIPARLEAFQAKAVQALAIAAFHALECEGLGRVDMFLASDGKLYVNEINTLPGFTAISMYPKLWEASGLPYRDLVSRLIELAIERHERTRKLETGYKGASLS